MDRHNDSNSDHPARDAARRRLVTALWRIYRRSARPPLFAGSGNLPWNDPAFSARMLREHLDEAHGAATRQSAERAVLRDWLWDRLELAPGAHLYDVTCGPGLYAVPLAERGAHVTGLDFAPAALAHARALAAERGVKDRCRFIAQDVTEPIHVPPPPGGYDAAMVLYGQLAVMPAETAQALLTHIAAVLRPGGRLCIELLDPARVDKKNSTWWYSDDTGLWGDAPYLHLGERFWDEDARASIERFQILHLDTGRLDEVVLCDQTYRAVEMRDRLQRAGFDAIDVYPAWDGLALYDAAEWIAYIAHKAA